MTIKQLCLEIARREKGKTQVNIAQIREIVSVLSDIIWEHYGDARAQISWTLAKNGQRRAKRRRRRLP